jgi:hypothetical protein
LIPKCLYAFPESWENRPKSKGLDIAEEFFNKDATGLDITSNPGH